MTQKNGAAKTLILGIGNSIVSDDGVGIRVAEECNRRFAGPQLTILETDVAGLGLLDLLVGFDKAIIIDAIQTVGGQPGRIYRLAPGMLHDTGHASFAHDVSLVSALRLGSELGLEVPQNVVIFAIEVSDTSTFSEECTPEVQQAIPACVEMIDRELSRETTG